MKRDHFPAGQALSPVQEQLVYATLRSILESPHFSKSKRYPALLEYIIVHTLSGESEALRERVVAAKVFDRPFSYDSSTDSTVRTIAGEVRRRMTAYFNEHPEAPVVIDLPLGSYVAEFGFRSAPALETAVPVVPADVAKQPMHTAVEVPVAALEPASLRPRKIPPVLWIVAVVLVVVAGALFANRVRDVQSHAFWWPMLHNTIPAVVVVGGRFDPSELQATVTQTETDHPPRSNTKIALGEAVALSEVCTAFHNFGHECRVRSAQSANDLRNNSLVLLGAFDNSLTQLFLAGARYRFDRRQAEPGESRSILTIVDTSKANGTTTWTTGPGIAGQTGNVDYAVLARFQSTINDGDVVVIAGLSAAGTQSAAEFAASSDRVREILSQAPKNWPGLNFEAVLQVNLIDGDPVHTQLVATQFW